MTKKTEIARKLFLDGFNCSQAVVGAFCDDLGMDFETAMKLSSSFGGGMGGLHEVCGALTGVFIVAGLKYGFSDISDSEAKARHYELIKKIAARFEEKEGSIICRDLLARIEKEDRAGYAKEYIDRPCLTLVETAVAITEEFIDGKFE